MSQPFDALRTRPTEDSLKVVTPEYATPLIVNKVLLGDPQERGQA
jgi:hypothetical protein